METHGRIGCRLHSLALAFVRPIVLDAYDEGTVHVSKYDARVLPQGML